MQSAATTAATGWKLDQAQRGSELSAEGLALKGTWRHRAGVAQKWSEDDVIKPEKRPRHARLLTLLDTIAVHKLRSTVKED